MVLKNENKISRYIMLNVYFAKIEMKTSQDEFEVVTLNSKPENKIMS